MACEVCLNMCDLISKLSQYQLVKFSSGLFTFFNPKFLKMVGQRNVLPQGFNHGYRQNWRGKSFAKTSALFLACLFYFTY